MRIGLLLLLLASLAEAQVPTPVRSATSLPATCNPGGGTGGAPADHIDIFSAGVNTSYYCSATNTWTAFTTGAGGLPTGVANGSQLVANGVGANPAYQAKPVYDIRDYIPTPTTDDTAAFTTLLAVIGSNPATIQLSNIPVIGSTTFPPNVSLQFAQNGGLNPLTSVTAPGSAAFVQGNSHVNGTVLTNSCSVTLTSTSSTNGVLFMENHAYVGALLTQPPTDGSNQYSSVLQQGYNFSSVNSAWATANIAGGTIIITINYPAVVANACMAWEISGMGKVIGVDAPGSANTEVGPGTTTMSAGPVTTTTGALLVGFGGQFYKNEVCTNGATYTQPGGAAGSVGGQAQPSTGYGESLCAEYRLASPGGSLSATQTINDDPYNVGLNKYWSYSMIAVIPASAVINIQGPVIAPAQKIFYNSPPGTIDLTGNTSIDKVFPEWWGAKPSATAAVNTPAIQAAINGAYGTNRVNGTSLNNYNRELHFSGIYNVNAALKAYHMNGFKWTCSNRLTCGLNQTAVNTTLLLGQSVTYGTFDDVGFSTSAAQDLSHPLVGLDYGAQGTDLATQFVDFNHSLINGNGLAAVGVQISPSGGGAQGSNIHFTNNLAEGFTEACYMIGAGSGGISSAIATNAIDLKWIGGDVQNCPAYGIENFGGQQLEINGTTFEPVFNAQTGYDIYSNNVPAGGNTTVDNVRSEGAFMIGGQAKFTVRNSYVNDQAFNIVPGNSPAIGSIIKGCDPAGHGVWYRVTVSGAASGLGSCGSPRATTSGTSVTLVDALGGLSVNAWTGWYVSLIAGTGKNTYCVVTSNSATTYTCSAGFVSDFPNTTIAVPDATTTFVVEPAWGTQTTSGGLTWAAITQTFGSGGGIWLIADDLFVPGIKLNIDPRSDLRNVKVTRSDWLVSGFFLDDLVVNFHPESVLAGVSLANAGTINNNPKLFRSYAFSRNGITGISNINPDQHGTAPRCWAAGLLGGSTATVEICIGGDPSTGSKNGRFYIDNKSSGTDKFTYFNADGSASIPGPLTSTGLVLSEGSAPSFASGQDKIWGNSGTHRLQFNPNNTSTLNIVGIANPAVGGDCPKFAANGIDLSDDGTCNVAPWNANQNPTGNLSLTMGANTSLFTYNATTGASDLFKLVDTLNNTGTGNLFRVSTASGSTAHAVQFDANGNGVQLNTSGVLTAVGTGGIAGAAVNSGTVASANGGTGATSLAYGVAITNGASPFTSIVPGSNGDCLQISGGLWVSSACPGAAGSAVVTNPGSSTANSIQPTTDAVPLSVSGKATQTNDIAAIYGQVAMTVPSATVMSQVTGGALGSSAYYSEATCIDNLGRQTTIGAESGPFTVSVNKFLVVTGVTTANAPAGCQGWLPYITLAGGASASETLQTITVSQCTLATNTVVNSCAIGANWTQTAVTTTGTAVPGSNTAKIKNVYTDASGNLNVSSAAMNVIPPPGQAGSLQLPGNTSLPPLTANSFALIAPNSASFSSWGIQFGVTPPSVSSVLALGAVAGGVSQGAPMALQGTDTSVLSSGTVSGTGSTLCTDANGGATTTGCLGSGVVSANNGSANELAIYTSAGGSTTVSADATLIDNGTTLAYTGTGGLSSAGGLVMTGPSGSRTTISTSTANANILLSPNGSGNVTTSGGLVFSGASGAATTLSTTTPNANLLLSPNGTGAVVLNNGVKATPSLVFAANTTNGFYSNAATKVCLAVTGNDSHCWKDTSYEIAGTGSIAWSQTSQASGTAGASMSIVGTSTSENITTSTQMLMPQCKITSAVTLSTASTTICSWNLPNSAQTWAWQCSGTYSITSGTTPDFGLGMNASQAPTSETGNALISSVSGSVSAAQVFTGDSATSTSSGNQSIYTSTATITTVALAPWISSGTVQASATAGTFAITGIMTGTLPAGTVNVGSTCQLY